MASRRRQSTTASGHAQGSADTPVTSVPGVPADGPLWRWLTPLLLVLVCAAAYSNAFDAGFALDNRQLILNDPRVHTFTAENLSLIAHRSYWWPYGESGLYRPLTTFSYLVDFAVLGHADRPAGYHGFNLLLHIGNVLMLWRLTRRLTANAWTAAATAAIWAVLPLSTEAVTNIVGRADLLAAAGVFAALLMYSSARDAVPSGPARENQTTGSGRQRARGARVAPYSVALYVGAALAIVTGALGKESAVAVLGVIVLLELCWWDRERSVRNLGVMLAVCALPLIAWVLQRSSVLALGGTPEFPYTDNPIVGASFGQGRLTALLVMWRYLGLLVWPARLSNDYSFAQIPLVAGGTQAWLGIALLGMGAIAALWQMRAHRATLFFIGFAFLTFLPASNLLFPTGTIMGERLMYLPSAGFAALAALGLNRLTSNPSLRPVVTALLVLIVGAYGLRTHARNLDWHDDVTLWQSAVASAPASAKAHRALAEALYAADPTHANIDTVIGEADTSVALLEELPDEQNTFQAFRQAGAYYLDKANASEDAARNAAPLQRAFYLRAQKLLDRAVVIARLGASQLPGGSVEPEADAQRLRAAALLGLGNPAVALIAANRARSLSPRHPLAYHLAASALLAEQRTDDAAILLLTGGIVSGDPALGRDAMTLYSSGLDSEGCAVSGSGASAALNPRCAIVQRHSCIASAAAYQILTKAGQADRARQIRDAAIATLACPPDLMDRSNSLVP